ncbi:hypothetical protein EV659_10237 [Rhodothalassium salexigens DSM 2132]|uniref:Capsule synthesis protein CapA domain-containing protein n=1 Tax=Rhodothalassium salexigens DSM 2132 TaxID=1188247 RepID=A0A4R2PPG0_RHOSA|nr:TIGR00282 family metallophosphoesterase [Rhodothalassium salexigens]MBB4210812.1 hypothetical protein [Rhodothalassium salexigens DSM 2132]MBK1639427.1 TIGR00282 family metallophosphoesterase [Rhodothalassium salexigens DSM 2132]TCP37633.1 hypothetical protein EV659_10237 [Rhodothalassium salexigens DSM 2132]
MRLLFLGDLMGRAGRTAAIEAVGGLRASLKADMVVVNGENAASGFGITGKIADSLFEAGVDVITGGNHSWDQKEVMGYIGGEPRLLRPGNFPDGTPGRGAGVFTATSGAKLLVVNVMGRVFMDPLDDPFAYVDRVLARHPLGGAVQAVLVDVHAEASSEKMAMGHFCDGRASLVVGTHSHVPTADAQILPGGTAYQTDAGMCGDYNSVIGMDKAEPVRRFTQKTPGVRFSPASGEATVCGVFVQTDDRTGLATRVEPVRLGGRLAEARPAL